MSQFSYYTEEGFNKLKDKLTYLTTKGRKEMSRQIAEARDKGDLSENAEYDAAKDAQGLLELEISKLQEIVFNARLINESEIDTSKVSILSKVKLKNKGNGATVEYILVSEEEANLKEMKISIKSPIGKGLLGKKIGDVAEVTIPSGTISFEILDISLGI
jgi:transcription elongation factor GreA